MQYTILVDFGSTYTKLCVLDLMNGDLILSTRHPSTVQTDGMIGLLANLEVVKKKIGVRHVKEAQYVASSSAAGGLRMVVVGLTPRYSLLAGKNVALSAGARIVKAYAFKLTPDDVREIEEIGPEILLLCGGTEGGGAEWTLHNAQLLSNSPRLLAPVVYAGNRKIAKEVRRLFLTNEKECYLTENVFPTLGTLNAAPASEIIRNIFMKRITGMKGLDKVKGIVGDIVMPTPAAVLAGGRLLSKGLPGSPGLGDCMVFDIGGATTDVYSYGARHQNLLKTVGSPEPDSKRTVEGDLGLRSSALSLLESCSVARLAQFLQTDEAAIRASCRYRTQHGDYVADSEKEKRLDFALAQEAVSLSARRHAGRILNAYAKGAREVQEGKDLTGTHTLIGTGGPIIHSPDPVAVLKKALRGQVEKETLLPESCAYYLDRQYLLYAIGLASTINARGAFQIARHYITEIRGE